MWEQWFTRLRAQPNWLSLALEFFSLDVALQCRVYTVLILGAWTLGLRCSSDNSQQEKQKKAFRRGFAELRAPLFRDQSNCPAAGSLKTSPYPLAHCCTIFLGSFGYQNIAQGGEWWPPIRWGILEMKLPRPNYTKLDPFFAKKNGVLYISEQGFFLGSCRSLFWALGSVSQKWGGFPKKEGVFHAFLCDITRQACSQTQRQIKNIHRAFFFTNGH